MNHRTQLLPHCTNITCHFDRLFAILHTQKIFSFGTPDNQGLREVPESVKGGSRFLRRDVYVPALKPM